MNETWNARSAEACGLPVPHEMSPAATAKKGTRRIPPAIRRLVGRQLTRERAMALVHSGQLEEVRARVVWKVGESAVVQPVQDLAIPSDACLVEPVRRIGTHEGAHSRIAMLPVIREGRAFMLTLDSGLELAWAQALDMHPDVSTLYGQPFMLIWDHEEGSIVHVPDLAAVVDGQLAVFEVKPTFRLQDPWIEARTGLAQRSLARGGAEYHLLGDVTRQRSMNLGLLSGYRRINPFLASEVQIGHDSNARTIGGMVNAICQARGHRVTPELFAGDAEATSTPDPDGENMRLVTSARIALEVAMHMLASGHVCTDLDQPLRLSSVLSRQHSSVASWSRW